MLDARKNGAEIRNYCKVNQIIQNLNSQELGVKCYEDRLSEELKFLAPVIVNATGAWSPKIATLASYELKLRPGKGVHIIFSYRILNYNILMDALDRRMMFSYRMKTTLLLVPLTTISLATWITCLFCKTKLNTY